MHQLLDQDAEFPTEVLLFTIELQSKMQWVEPLNSDPCDQIKRGNVFFMLLYPAACQLKTKFLLCFFFLYVGESVANIWHATVKKRAWAFELNHHGQILRHHLRTSYTDTMRLVVSPLCAVSLALKLIAVKMRGSMCGASYFSYGTWWFRFNKICCYYGWYLLSRFTVVVLVTVTCCRKQNPTSRSPARCSVEPPLSPYSYTGPLLIHCAQV